jgi:hypothetical protein
VTFGLVTTGIYRRTWKAEASAFNGREPDEQGNEGCWQDVRSRRE